MDRVLSRGRSGVASMLVFVLLFSPFQVFAEEITSSVADPPVDIPESSSSETPPQEAPPDESSTQAAIPEENSPPQSLLSETDPQPLPESLTQFTYQNPAKIDQFTGALIKTIPLNVPPGRLGVEPKIALEYNSQRTDEGIVGYGWTIDIPYIQRLNKTGSERLYIDNYFTSSLGGELATTSLSTSTPVEYRPKVENGDFIKYFYSGASWIAYDKKGTRYTFGTTSQARQTDPDNSSRTYKWMLEEIRDTNNNFVRYEYDTDSNQIYPDKIYYTGHNSSDGIFLVEFTRSSRPDPYTSYQSGFKIETDYRITEVKTSVNSQWVRKYTLGYGSGHNGVLSLLQSVSLTGRDQNATEFSLPAMTFQYASSTQTFLQPNTTRNITTPALVVGDRNGDGLNDITFSYLDSGQPSWRFWTNTGSSFNFTSQINSSLIPEIWGAFNGTTYSAYSPVVRILDINGDGKIDILEGEKNDDISSTTINLYNNAYATSTGYAWPLIFATTSTTTIPIVGYTPPGDPSVSTGVFGNFNGDAYPDYSIWLADPDEIMPPIAYMGNGSAWTASTSIFEAQKEMTNSSRNSMYNNQSVDINGDGLDDWVYMNSTSTRFCINTGSQWEDTCNSVWNLPFTTLYLSTTNTNPSTYYDRGMRFMDINGDGLTDFVRAYKMPSYSVSNAPQIEVDDVKLVLLNTGSGWATSTTMSSLLPDYITTGLAPSGIWAGAVNFNEYAQWHGNGQQNQDVMSKITYPQGGFSDIVYASTTADLTKNPELPISLLVVKTITTDDGNNNDEVTEYDYSGGKMYQPQNPLERRLAGFASTTATTGNKLVRTYYHQGDGANTSIGEQADGSAYIGKAFRSETVDTNTSKTLKRDFYKFNTLDQGGGRNFVFKAAEVSQDFNSIGIHRDSAKEFVYATSTGDVMQIVERGEVIAGSDGSYTDTGSDLRITTIAYATSTTINLTLPYLERMVDSASTTLTETKHFYDSLSLASIATGNETRQERWISGVEYASTTRSYNLYGLVASSTDARGATTTIVYETYNIYPATTTNALGHARGTVYDFATGKVATTYDPNGFRMQSMYDPLGRLTEIKQPDLTTPSTLVTKTTTTYTDGTFPTFIVNTNYLNAATSTDTYVYFDGLGRTIQKRSEAEAAGSFNVKDYVYGINDLVDRESLPYRALSASYAAATTTGTLFAVNTYDALGRLTAMGTAVGTTSTAYGLWTSTTTDALGHAKAFTHDAYGNLSQVTEQFESEFASTNYGYDLRNNLSSITDALSNTRNFTYDGLSRRLTAQDLHASGDATFGTYTFAYDHAGNLTQKTDPKSQVVSFTYDPLNRPLSEDYTGTGGTEATYSYDSCTNGIGYLCVASSTASRFAYAYNPLGLYSAATTTIDGTSYAMNYLYDRQGNFTSAMYPNGSEIRYSYGTDGRLSTIQAKPFGSTFSAIIASTTYIATGQESYRLYGNGTENFYIHDSTELYRLTHLGTTTAEDSANTHSLSLVKASSQRATATDSASLSIPGDITIESWVKFDSLPANGISYAIVSKDSATAGDSSYELELYRGGGTLRLSAVVWGPSVSQFEVAWTPTTGTWYHVAVTVSGTAGKFYVNGSQQGSTQTITSQNPLDDGAAPLMIGADNSTSPGGHFDGTVDDVRIWSTARSQSDISSNMNIELSGSETNLKAYYQLDNVYTDATGNGNTLTAVNSPSFGTNVPFIGAAYVGTTSPQNIDYVYDAVGNITQITDRSISQAAKIVNFTYDTLNRLLTASTTSASTTPYNAEYTYSKIGNLTNKYEGIGGGIGTGSGENSRSIALARSSSKRATAADSTSLSFSGDISIEAWIKIDSLPSEGGSYAILSKDSSTGANSSYEFELYRTSGTYRLSGVVWGASVSQFEVPWTPSVSTWYHVAMTVSGTSGKFYVNGSQQGSTQTITAQTINDGTASLMIGADNSSSPGSHFDGLIDEVRVWNSLRSGSDFTANKDTELTGSETNLKAYWQLDDDYTDTTANSNTLTPSNSPTFSIDVPFAGSAGPTSYTYAGTGYANPHAATTISSVALTYDNNGNTLTFGSSTYAWDWRNRMSSTGDGHATSSFAYAHDENRIKQSLGSSTTYYPHQFYSVQQSVNGATTTSTSTSYIYAGGTLVATINQVYINGSATGSPAFSYIHPDHLGSTNVVTNASGIVQTLDYYPYGSTRINTSVGGADEKKKFAGMERDASTGLDYLNARYYEGRRGQFTSQDPVFLNLGVDPRTSQVLKDPQQMNSYSYARGNPLTYKDPDGELAVLALFAIGALVNVGLQGFEDLSTGSQIRWENYAGAAIGGVAGTAALLATRNPVAVGAATGGAEEYASQLLRAVSSGDSMDYTSVIAEAGLGALFGKYLPGIQGVTAGRNSMEAISKQIATKLSNGTIQNFTPSTASKILTSQFVSGIPQSFVSAGYNVAQSSAVSGLAQSFGVSSFSSAQVSAIEQVRAAFSK